MQCSKYSIWGKGLSNKPKTSKGKTSELSKRRRYFVNHDLNNLSDYGEAYPTLSGHYRSASEAEFKWRFAGGQTVAQVCMLAVIRDQNTKSC